MNLLIFAASRRKQSINRKLAALTSGMAQRAGAEVDLPEYADFDSPMYDDETFDAHMLPASAARFVAHMQAADGIVIASPEYNWSFPGSLKNVIDWASVAPSNPFAGKTALLLSASPSLRGGLQGLLQLATPLSHLGMFVFPRFFALSRAEEAFGDGDMLKDEKLTGQLERLVADFMQATKALSSQKS